MLIQRSRLSRFFGRQWDVPGGKVDVGEDFDEALHREVKEETGLRVNITGVAGATEHELPKVRVVLLFLETRRASGKVRLSEEHEQFKWVSLAEACKMDLSPQVRPVVGQYANLHRRSRFRLAQSKRKEKVQR